MSFIEDMGRVIETTCSRCGVRKSRSYCFSGPLPQGNGCKEAIHDGRICVYLRRRYCFVQDFDFGIYNIANPESGSFRVDFIPSQMFSEVI